jgi:hypothetical protein
MDCHALSRSFIMKSLRKLVLATALASAIGGLPMVASAAEVIVTYGEKAQKAIEKTYGVREKATLEDEIRTEISQHLGSRVARVEVTINDVVANRPTLKQMSDKPGLSFSSFGIGGADLSGKAFDAGGQLLADVSYDWYGDIHLASTTGVWSDAERAIERFTEKLARATGG